MKAFTRSFAGRVAFVASGAALMAVALTGCGVTLGVSW